MFQENCSHHKLWINHIDAFELSYDACFKADIDFGATVLGLFDLTFFQFCDFCLKAEAFEDVNFTSISLETDRYHITKNTFQANKPYHLAVQQKKTGYDLEGSDKEIKKKRQKLPKEDKYKSHYEDLGNMVKNQNPVSNWKFVLLSTKRD